MNRILLAPVATEQHGLATIRANWQTKIDELIDGPPPDKKEPKDSQDDPNKRSAPEPPPDKSAVGDDGITVKPDKAGGTPAAAPTNLGDKAGEKVVAAPAPPVTEGKTDWDKMPLPKNAKEWGKARDTWHETENALKKEISTRDTQLAEFQTKLAESEKRATESAESPELKSEIERKDAQIKDLTDRIMVLDVTQHPKFQKYFSEKTDAAVSKAKRLVGADKAEQIEKIIKLPESDYKNLQLEEFLGDIESDLTKTRLGVVLEELENVEIERQSEIKKANDRKTKLNGDQTLQSEQSLKERQQMFDQVVKGLQDSKTGFAPFQLKADDKAWNEGVEKRIQAARGLIFGENVKPEQVTQAAFYAVTLPLVLKSYGSDAEKWKQEKAGLEAKIAELVAAQPKGGAGGTTVEDEDSPVAHIKPGATRSELDKATLKRINRLINE